MPYTTIDDLPDAVKKLPEARQKRWLAAFNAAYEKDHDDEKAMKVAWSAVKESALTLSASLREASNGRTFDVVIVKAGASLNKIDGRPVYYSEELLKSSVDVFEGATVNSHAFGKTLNHIPDEMDELKGLFTENTVGVLEGVHFGEGALRASLVLHEGADFMSGLLKLSVERDPPLVGLSLHVLSADVDTTATVDGLPVSNVIQMFPPATVDIVSTPAAGGEIVRLAASLQKEKEMPEEVKKPPEGDPKPAAAVKDDPPIDLEKLSESAAEKALAKIREEQKARDEAKAETLAKIKESEELLETKLKESNLPEKGVALVRRQFEKSTFKEETLDAAIADVRTLLKEADESGKVNVPGDRFEGGEQVRTKLVEAELYDMFMQNSVEETRNAARKSLLEAGGKPVASIKRLMREAFGIDVETLDGSTGRDRKRLTESLVTTDWTDIFGDTMNRALLDAYHANPWTDWRKVVRMKPLSDFRTQHSIRMGGFGNLATVGEGVNYPAVTSPGDEEHEWTPAKRGGTEDLTREMILADDVMAIGRIPTGLAYAAARTVYEFVFDQLTIAGQPTMDYDSTALFATSRTYNDNLGTTALAAAEVAVVWLAMQQFVDMTSLKREAISPKYLCVPVNLAATAFGIVKPLSEFAPGETTDTAFVRTMGLETIVVAHWTNAKDHVYVADPALVPGFLFGFVNGVEDPQLFVQDNQNFGSMFDRDAITYKIRHEYGGSPVDHRAFYAEDVA
jgi:cation transport regulator ChaB